MKRVYMKPEVQVIEISLKSSLLTFSANAQENPSNAMDSGWLYEEEIQKDNSRFNIWDGMKSF